MAADRRGLPARADRGVDDRMGRAADEPHQIPAAGWWDILKRLFADIGRDNVSLMAAGIAFYGLLSLAPGFTALPALYGLVFGPPQVQAQVPGREGMNPEQRRKPIAHTTT